VQVGADAVRVGEPEDLGHAVGVDQIFGVHGRSHEESLGVLTLSIEDR
jgi:hypothetical protein